jgi:hypothetical protein
MNRALLMFVLATCIAALSAFAYVNWDSNRKTQEKLRATLSHDERFVADANKSISDRDTSLRAALEQIATFKKKNQTPGEVVKQLPNYLRLPRPITISATPPSAMTTVEATFSKSGQIIQSATPLVGSIPSEDLKPLFDFVQDCRTANVKLEIANQDSADYVKQMVALRSERDVTISALKEGGVFKRLKHDVVWLLAGAVVGYVGAER